MHKASCLKESFRAVKERGIRLNNQVAYCKSCRALIKFAAAKMRIFVKGEDGFINDTQSLADVLHIFCPGCDGGDTKVYPGAIAYKDDIGFIPLREEIDIAPGVIEHGYFMGKRSKSIVVLIKVIQRVEAVDFTFHGELEALERRLQNPLERIKWLKEMRDREMHRQKEERIRRILESWNAPTNDVVEPQWRDTERKRGTVTVMIDDHKFEVEI